MDLSVELFDQVLDNPLIPASGCLAFGREAAQYQDLKDWGVLLSTAVTLEARQGNPAPRVCETASGMLNSVGLQNPGLDYFMQEELPFMQAQHRRVMVNVAGSKPSDYIKICEKLEETSIFALELNLSCPNVKEGGMSIGTHPEQIYSLVKACRERSSKPLVAKLTPNVTDVASCAQAAEAAGASAVSLVNTFLAMSVDIFSRRPVLKNNTGGLSGPAIKPIALRMVSQVYQAVDIPVIGIGGIKTGQDVLEFMLCGATCVELGSANFQDPHLAQRVKIEMKELAEQIQLSSLDAWIGQLNYWKT